MLPAPLSLMHNPTTWLAMAAALGGCAAESALIEGSLLDADDVQLVWVEGAAGPAFVEGQAFRLETTGRDTIELLFGEEGEALDDPAGRMRIIGARGVRRLALDGIWFEDDVAFPTSVEVDGARLVEVNGLRMGSADALGERVDARGFLLAISRDEEHAIFRPLDEGLPDLRVVIGESTAVLTGEGDEIGMDGLEFGDTMVVRGEVHGGYVHATELVLAPAVVARLEAEESRTVPASWRASDDDEREARDLDDLPGRWNRPGWVGRGRGRGRNE